MKETDLLKAVRSLLRSDEVTRHRSHTYSSTDTETADEPGVDGFEEGFPVPAERDGEFQDVLIELNVTTHEYIRKALQHHGGRLRQQEIAELTGWSEPTVSQRLGEMEDDGLITRFRTGREKIVCLPDESPVDSDGPPADPDEVHESPDAPSQ